MKLVAMNKTEIIDFIIDEAASKLWNVSSDMRKRLKYMFKLKKVTIREYNEKVFKLIKWVNVGKDTIQIKGKSDIKQGIANFEIRTQLQFDYIQSLNREIRCNGISTAIKPTYIGRIDKLEVRPENYKEILEFSFNKVRFLKFFQISEKEIQAILGKIRSVQRIEVNYSTIKTLDLTKAKPKYLFLDNLTVNEALILPPNLTYLHLRDCKQIKNIKDQKIVEVEFCSSVELKEEELEWVKGLKRLFKLTLFKPIEELIDNLPPGVVSIYCNTSEETLNLDPTEAKEKMPFCRQISESIGVKVAEELNLRHVWPKFTGNEGTLTFKPRRIKVNDDNVVELNKHPELFEKASQIAVYDEKFNFDLLTTCIRKLDVMHFNANSKLLSRFRGQFVQIEGFSD